MAKLTETVNFRLTPEEKKLWLQYCEMTARTQNDVFREYLRTIAKKMLKKGASNPATLDPHSSHAPPIGVSRVSEAVR